MSSITFTHRAAHDISFRADSGPSGVYRFEPALAKPCFHPLTTAQGVTVTGFEPADHLWHRGLWFTIKFINGTNFWEETPGTQFGSQVSAQEPSAEIIDGRLRILHRLIWRSAPTGDVLEETRVIHLSVDDEGILTIDWSTSLLALQDLMFDRTPYTTWGGYSGFTFRGGGDWDQMEVLTAKGERKNVLVADEGDWILLEGRVGAAGGVGGREVSVGLTSHPLNPRSPVPWYGKALPEYVFLNAAFLFHGPMTLAKHTTLRFQHKCIIRDGRWPGDFARHA